MRFCHLSYKAVACCILMAVCALLPARAARDRADTAAVYFNAGRYDDALRIWYDIVQKENAGAGVYYNIGLAESVSGRIPYAVLAFEHAARLKPADRRIRRGLAEERKKIVNGAIPVEPFFLTAWYNGFLSLLRPGAWALCGIAIWLLAMFSYLDRSIMVFGSRLALSSKAIAILAISGLCMMLAAGLAYGRLHRTGEAVLFEICELRQAPAVESPLIRTLHPGEKVTLRDSIGEWYQVHLVNYEAGWLRKECRMPAIGYGRQAAISRLSAHQEGVQ